MPQVLQPLQRVTNGDMSADVTSLVIDGRYITNLKFQIVWTGTPTGTFTLEESMDYVPATGVGTWIDNGAAITAPSGSAGYSLIYMANRAPTFYRVVYHFTSGSGALNVWASGSGPS